jgi:hypothetical protein
MSPYGDRFGGDNEIPSDCALDRIASSDRPSRTLITPTGVLPSARSRNCCTSSSVQACPLLRLDVVRHHMLPPSMVVAFSTGIHDRSAAHCAARIGCAGWPWHAGGMCGRYASTASRANLLEQFDVDEDNAAELKGLRESEQLRVVMAVRGATV